MSFANVQRPCLQVDFATLYHADINNDGEMEWILCERNSVALHNDQILGIYRSAFSSGVMIDSQIPIPMNGTFNPGPLYQADPFLRGTRWGITMRFLEGLRARPIVCSYLWKDESIRRVDPK